MEPEVLRGSSEIGKGDKYYRKGHTRCKILYSKKEDVLSIEIGD